MWHGRPQKEALPLRSLLQLVRVGRPAGTTLVSFWVLHIRPGIQDLLLLEQAMLCSTVTGSFTNRLKHQSQTTNHDPGRVGHQANKLE